MKFSINTPIASLAALICTSSSSMLGASADVADDSKSNNIISSVSRATFQHDQIIRLSENNKKRLLQEPTACQQATWGLFNNTQLVEAYYTYMNNYNAIVNNEVTFDDSCDYEALLSFDKVCDLHQGESIVGQEEYEKACTDLGAKVVKYDTTITCNVDSGNVAMQYTAFVDCNPLDCEEEEIVEMIEKMFAPVVDGFESRFTFNDGSSVNAANVECGISLISSTESGAASVGSKTLLSVLMVAVLSIILSAM